MKKYIILLFVFTSLVVQSQFNPSNGRNNQRQRQRIPQTAQKTPEPNFQIGQKFNLRMLNDAFGC